MNSTLKNWLDREAIHSGLYRLILQHNIVVGSEATNEGLWQIMCTFFYVLSDDLCGLNTI